MRARILIPKRLGPIAASILLGGGPMEAQESPTLVEQLVGFHVLDDGHWRQDNPESSAKDERPTHWVREVAWGPGRDVVVASAFSVYRDGRCEAVAHLVYYLDRSTDRVGLRSFSGGGVVGEGYVEALGPTENRLAASVTLPDGSVQRIRDTSIRSRTGEYSTHAERWLDGEWVAGDTVVWRARPTPRPCSGRP